MAFVLQAIFSEHTLYHLSHSLAKILLDKVVVGEVFLDHDAVLIVLLVVQFTT